jgi:hypothetical protein
MQAGTQHIQWDGRKGMKDALRAKLAGARWPEQLPWVLLGLRAIHNVPCTLYSVHVNKQRGNMQLNRLKNTNTTHAQIVWFTI